MEFQYQYLLTGDKPDKAANDMASDGWELCGFAVTGSYMYHLVFRKPRHDEK